MEVSTKQLMEIFGVTSKSTPPDWRKKGASVAYLKRDTWDLGEFVQWWADNVYLPKDNQVLVDYRERIDKARAEKLEIEVERLRGDLLPREEMQAALIELITLAKRGFTILPKAAPSILYGKTETEMMATLERMVMQILDDMARGATVGEIEKKIKT